MTDNHQILDQDQAAALLGYESAKAAATALERQGIRPVYGRRGRWFIALAQIVAAQQGANDGSDGDRVRI